MDFFINFVYHFSSAHTTDHLTVFSIAYVTPDTTFQSSPTATANTSANSSAYTTDHLTTGVTVHPIVETTA